jgi:hypothetical protein
MAAKNNVTVSVDGTQRRPSYAERRAAQTAALATQQADLKREAAERRAKRAALDAASPKAPKTTAPRRSRAR